MDQPKSIDLDTVRLKGQSDELQLYAYRDASGRDVVTNDLASVPHGAKLEALVEQPSGPTLPTTIYGVHVASAALGLAVGVSVVLVPRLLRRRPLVAKLITVPLIVVALGGLYFGWVMRMAGFEDDGLLRDPRRAVDEAKQARNVANQRTRTVEQLADQLDR